MFKKFLLTLGLILFCGLFFFYSAAAQGTPPTPTPTIEPTVIALQQQVEALSTQVAGFEAQIDLKEQSLQLDATRQMLPYQTWAAIIAILATVFGISSPFVVYRYLSQKFQKQLDRAVYKSDPTYYPIFIPGNNFSREEKRLRQLGFRNLRPYVSLTSAQLQGIVIYSAKDLHDVEVLSAFVKDNSADAKKVAFVIYAQYIPGGVEAMGEFDGFSFANHPVTIASQVYALVRGMKK